MRAPSASSRSTSLNPSTSRKNGKLCARASTAIPTCEIRVPRGLDGVIKFIAEGAASPHKLNDEAPRGILRSGDYKMSNALEVNDSDFEIQIEQHKGLAVVDFWAT